MKTKQFEKGDLVYDTKRDQIGIILAAFHINGYCPTYDILMNERGRISEILLGVYDCIDRIYLIEKGAFK